MYKVYIEDQPFEIEFKDNQPYVNGSAYSWDVHGNHSRSFHVVANHKSYRIQVLAMDPDQKLLTLRVNGHEVQVKVHDRYDLLLEQLGMDMEAATTTNEVRAPMPGLIVELKVDVGTQVEAGDALLVLEAMKMENVLKAPGPGTIKSILVDQGDSVEKNQILVDFE